MTRKRTKIIHVNEFAAEIPVELIDEDGWGPCISLQDARKLEEVAEALRVGDVATAAKFGRIFKLTPIS